jgi:hypothetical protein
MSMQFNAYDADGNCVFGTDREKQETSYLLFDSMLPDAEPKNNPHYRPELDISLSNSNARLVAYAVGMEVGDCFVSSKEPRDLLVNLDSIVRAPEVLHANHFNDENLKAILENRDYIQRKAAALLVFTAIAIDRGAVEIYAA